jgi:hypothetical protein
MSWTDIQEYESLRLKEAPARGRLGPNPKLVASGPKQTIMLSQRTGTPYVCFRIVEDGAEFMFDNVLCAIPKGADLATKLRKTVSPAAPKARVASPKKAKKNVPRRLRGPDGDIVVMPKRRPGQTKSVVSPVLGVNEDVEA